jgi:hypothetical protein
MLRACGKRLIVPIGAVTALIWVAALLWTESAPAAAMSGQNSQKPAFARIVVSDKSVVYIQIQGDELRAATSVEGLQSAAPVKSGRAARPGLAGGPFEFTLPVPADQLPAGVTAIKGKLGFALVSASVSGRDALSPYFYGQLIVSRLDSRKAEWQYVSQVGLIAGASAENAPEIKLPNLDKISAALEARPSSGKLAVGLHLTADVATLADVLEEGRPVQVKMVVTDASGAEKASKVGRLSDFGFS